jgi:hypothetical protein
MKSRISRRALLQGTAAGGVLAGLGDLSFLGGLAPVSADEAQSTVSGVRLRPEIEPLVRLIEETPRERLLEEVGLRMKQGAGYPDVLAALLLAGVRNVQPRPSVGFKFHAVLVVNSAHLASLASPNSDRWLPIFWALDHFKESQARDESEGDWTMQPVAESAVPGPEQARQAFTDALERWDEAAADTAIAGLTRTAGAADVYETFWRYSGRDFRSIGHKAIYAANSWRTLQCIGWQHAEPVTRSLAYAMLAREGGVNPAESDLPADLPGRRNQERLGSIRGDWEAGAPSREATLELLQCLRSQSADDAAGLVVEQLNRGVAPQSVWDAMFLASGELLMRQPGIVGLHTVTTTNALYQAYLNSGVDATRRFVLLQNAAFLPMFLEAMRGRGSVGDVTIESLEPAPLMGDQAAAAEEIFADVSRDKMQATRKALGYLGEPTAESSEPAAAEGMARAGGLITAARRLIFLKGNDAHDYKFSSAVLEDYYHVSPEWRNRYLAASMHWLTGSGEPDNDLVQRTRAALG